MINVVLLGILEVVSSEQSEHGIEITFRDHNSVSAWRWHQMTTIVIEHFCMALFSTSRVPSLHKGNFTSHFRATSYVAIILAAWMATNLSAQYTLLTYEPK